jgi:hypothetical protein
MERGKGISVSFKAGSGILPVRSGAGELINIRFWLDRFVIA